MNTVEPLSKGQLGPAILSFVGRLSSFQKLKCIAYTVHVHIGDIGSVLCREVIDPFLRGSILEVPLYIYMYNENSL